MATDAQQYGASLEERRAAMFPVISGRSYRAVLRRIDAWIASGYATEEQRRALADWITA
jgi:hypothetical protein